MAAFAFVYAMWSLRLALGAPVSWFSSQDLSAIYYAWSRPFGDLIRGTVIFFGYYSRPLGKMPAWFLYQGFGLNPAPWQAFRAVLALAAAAALSLLANRVSRSREIALFTVIIAGFRTQLLLLYSDLSAVPEALALIFFCAAFLACTGQPGKTVQTVLLFIAAICSHEVAIVFPAAILLYELILGNRRFRASLTTGLVAIIFLTAKLYGVNITDEPVSPLHFSISQFIQTSANTFGTITLTGSRFTETYAAIILATALALAVSLRNRLLIWAALFNFVAILPSLCFPAPTGPALLLPLAGWGLYTAALFTDVRMRLIRMSGLPVIPSQAALAGALCLVAVWPEVKVAKRVFREGPQKEQFLAKGAWDTLAITMPSPWTGKRILSLHDPFPEPGTLLRLARLGASERNARIISLRPTEKLPPFEDFDYVIDYYRQRFILVRTGHPAPSPASRQACTGVAPLGRGSHDDTDPRINWDGSWTRETKFQAAFSGTIAYSNSVGAGVCWNFEGTGFRYSYTKAFNRGIAAVAVDGIHNRDIDLYGSTVQWQASSRIEGLMPGWHRAAIEPTGRRNELASDTYVDLDAVEVF